MEDDEYAKAIEQLAEYADALGKAEALSGKDTISIGDTMRRVFDDGRWVAERESDRRGDGPRRGRPVDPTSRAQFAQWLRERWHPYAPRTTYQLLDAAAVTANYLRQAQVIPSSERQLRPLKPLLKPANGGGTRVEPIWQRACELATRDGRVEPTGGDVAEAKRQWYAENIPKTQQRQERADDRSVTKRARALAAWRELFRLGNDAEINAFVAAVREDIQKWNADHE